MIESGYLGVENYGRARGHVGDSEEEEDEEDDEEEEEEEDENEKEEAEVVEGETERSTKKRRRRREERGRSIRIRDRDRKGPRAGHTILTYIILFRPVPANLPPFLSSFFARVARNLSRYVEYGIHIYLYITDRDRRWWSLSALQWGMRRSRHPVKGSRMTHPVSSSATAVAPRYALTVAPH